MAESIGIVIRTKNRPLLLRRALESIANQTVQDCPVIIVNDTQSSNTVQQVIDSSSISKNIQLINNPESLGPAAAGNIGVQALDTTYVAFLDDDNTWAPEFLQRTRSALEHRQKVFPTVQAAASHINRVFEQLDNNMIRIENVINWRTDVPEGVVSLARAMESPSLSLNGTLYTRAALLDVHGFDDELDYLEDWDLTVRFIGRYDIWMDPYVLAFEHMRREEYGYYANLTLQRKDFTHIYQRFLYNQWIRQGIDGSHVLGLLAELSEFRTSVKDSLDSLTNTVATLQKNTEKYVYPLSPKYKAPEEIFPQIDLHIGPQPD